MGRSRRSISRAQRASPDVRGSTSRGAMTEKLRRIYLNDHRAGAIAGLELTKRCLSNNKEGDLGAFLQRLLTEIREDLLALEEQMGRLQVPLNPVKAGAAWMAEKVGRLKLNGRVRGYSPLSRLLEREGLTRGVEGKLRLWRALSELAKRDARLDPAELQRLIERAERQLEELEAARTEAVANALMRD